jgi:Secretion system C-terminal sorting domain
MNVGGTEDLYFMRIPHPCLPLPVGRCIRGSESMVQEVQGLCSFAPTDIPMNTRYSLATLALLTTTWTIGQTITLADAPVAGNAASYSDIEGPHSISTGANQVWNINGAATPLLSGNFVNPASIVGGPSVPLATVALEDFDGQVSYLRADATGLQLAGDYYPSDGSYTVFADTWTFLKYPCSYGTTWVDGYDDLPPTTFTAVGFGTLNSNGGSFSNVLMVRNGYSIDTVIGSEVIHDEELVDWFWKPGHPFFAARTLRNLYIVNGDTIFSSNVALVSDAIAIGLAENSEENIGIDLAPNPANGQVAVAFGVAGNTTIAVYDAVGRAVLSVNKGDLPPGIHREMLDLAGLAPGRYMVRIANDRGEQGVKALVVE